MNKINTTASLIELFKAGKWAEAKEQLRGFLKQDLSAKERGQLWVQNARLRLKLHTDLNKMYLSAMSRALNSLRALNAVQAGLDKNAGLARARGRVAKF